MRLDRPPGAPGPASTILEVDLSTLAQTIREQRALPVTPSEADTLARSIEDASTDEERLANTLAVLRLLVDRLEQLPGSTATTTAPRGPNPAGISARCPFGRSSRPHL